MGGSGLVKFGKKGASAPEKKAFWIFCDFRRGRKGERRKSTKYTTRNNGGNESTMAMTRADQERTVEVEEAAC